MEGIRLEMFEETRHLEPPKCEDELARLSQQLKDTRDELSVYRLASEIAMYEAGQFDAGLFLSGDRGVEDVMRRVLRTLEEARRELALWKRRAEAQLHITVAALALTSNPYELIRMGGDYWVSGVEYKNLQAACREFKQLAESEAGK